MPNVQMVHVDRMLSNISIGFKNEDFIADQIFKSVTVDHQSNRYYVYGKEAFRQHDDRRAPGTDANEIAWRLSDDTFYCEGHALRHPIPDEEIQNADDSFNLESDGTELVTQGILLNKEIDAASKLLDASSYDSSLVVATGGAGQPLKWSNDLSNPVHDIENIKRVMHQKSGLMPNTLVMSYPVFSRLRIHPVLLAYFKFANLSIIPIDMMKEFFDIPNIIVGKALKSTEFDYNGGQDPLSYIWGNSAVLGYVPTTPGRKTPALGYSFMWNKDGDGAVQVRRWYETGKRSTIIEAERWYSQKIVSSVAGCLFPDVI